MRRSLCNTIRTILVLVLALSFLAGANKPVQAADCVWEGDTSADWFTIANWSCGRVPISEDDVSISSGTPPNQPTIGETASVTVNTITINSGATLTILNGSAVNAATWTVDGALVTSTGESVVYINILTAGGGVVTVGSDGSITKLGTGNLVIYASFNNHGTVIFNEHGTYDGGVSLVRGGEHTGIFQGEYLYVGNNDYASGQIFNFYDESELFVNQVYARGSTVNILGWYSPPNITGTILSVQPQSGTCLVTFKNGGNFLKMPESILIDSGGKLILESQTYNYYLPKLYLDNNSELQNLGNLHITTQILLYGGKISGNGTTTVESPAVFTIGLSTSNGFTLDTQTLINDSTANWNSKNIMLSNEAEIINNIIFNANATTTMTGGETEVFTNNGSFIKNIAATTTTMNIPYMNEGTVDVVAGSLIFQQGMDNGADAVIDLGGGTLDPGDELNLESGDSLIGSGTLAADLVNGGTVSPGASPGVITVDGDYTQTADGVLEIQLGGTNAATPEFDQLIVTGFATLSGTLKITLLPGFTPQEGDTFFILDNQSSGTGEFSVELVPPLSGGLTIEIDYSDEGVTLTVLRTGTDTFIFLPMIVR